MIVKVFDKIFISNVYDANNVYKLISLNIGGVLTCFECNGIEWCSHHESDKNSLLFYKDRLINFKGELPKEADKNDNKAVSSPKTESHDESEHCDHIIFPREILNDKMENNTIRDYINSMVEIENDDYVCCFKNSESNLKEPPNLETNESENKIQEAKVMTNVQTVCELNKTMRENLSISYDNIYKIKHMYLNILDTFDENILNHVEKAHEFIDKTINENKNILIHCMAGISRCSSIILSYVSRKNQKGINHNFSILKSRYPFAHPNENFYRQLLLYEKMNYNLDGSNEYHNIYKKIKLSNKFLEDLKFCNLNNKEAPTCRYSCKFCRRVLFNDNDIIEHDTTKNQIKKKYGKFCTSIFIEKKEWILTDNKMKGIVYCPNASCNTKLGKWSWTGICCSCGYLQIPAFMFNDSNVDRMKININ
ncbi:dual specificity protein phosphatase, putative [Plasmodium chabaudi chabaudi]|uniref:protein-tyrosine-phosphatase n=1 Tax=Plasmodium chabaudi chabaudi TaxID=31271 RepID=A0A4V0K4E5_PLACU|nr:dual specificity protein phosphatase, putative [Plasmodium chabaudi chabaudi]VTZ67207.1 dual specificity protein phosphatase, putative [Plasmodium chabaudi chabaudi]|eukprot:XP_016653282.1 dual specificity protein phosphatase, putative [Plasmodium chabaudi chabaudi]